LLPGGFLPEVDEHSLVDLAEHALVTSLCDWTTFAEAGFDLHLAVNVPVRALLKLPITQLVSEHRPKSERWPGLILEVVEDQILRDIVLVNAIAEQLRASSITIAIDDFDAGNSSFSSLHELPITELKIAGSFTRNCATDPAKGAICRTAIDLAHGTGGVAVADGIESALDMQSLMVMGCDFAQGSLIAPFLPKQEFLDLLRQRNAPQPTTPRDIIQAGVPLIGRVA
jgi:EAL domain-containing protein (putative c-di-GMP-specific phosphodiesterase class I)